MKNQSISCFNPAEAEEGFSSGLIEEQYVLPFDCFNPAEAEEGFSSCFIQKWNH